MDSRLVAISDVCRDLFSGSVPLKLIFGLLMGAISVLINQNMYQVYLAVFLLVVLDSISGLAVVWVVPGARLESKKLTKTVIKFMMYGIAFVATNQAEIATNNVLPFIDETVLGYIAITELISVLENLERLGMKVPRQLLNKLSAYRGAQATIDTHPKNYRKKV